MSPDAMFWLELATKMAVTAAFLVAATAIAERAGPLVGGLVATLPISAGPVYLFLALDHDSRLIAASAMASLAANAVTGLFALIYILVAQVRGPLASLAVALGFWLAAIFTVRSFQWTLPGALAINAASYLVAVPVARRFRSAKSRPPLVIGSFALRRRALERIERFERLAWRKLVRIKRGDCGKQGLGGALARGSGRGTGAPDRSEQRQIVHELARRRDAVLRLELREHELGPLDDGGRQPGELGDLDAVGTVRRAGHHFVQEHDLVLPFLDPHRRVEQARQLRGKPGQLVKMRDEQRAAAVLFVQMLDRRPGDRQPVEGRGAATDLVENDQRARPRLIEDRGGLDHFHHEGGAAAGEIVGGADPGEQPVDDADARAARRHEASHLRQHGDQGVLAQN